MKKKIENKLIKCAYTKLVPLEDIHLDPNNSNTHPGDQIDELIEQFKFQGIRHPIIISLKNGFVAAGEGRYLAAKKMGLKEYPCDFQNFDSEEQQFAFGVADNAIQSWSKLDLTKIHHILPDMDAFNIDRLAIKDFKFEPDEPKCDEDEVPEIPKVSKVRLGDLWELGGHRILCGDSTKKEEVDRLMNGEKADMVFTDPPYGIDLDPARFESALGSSNSMNFQRKKKLVIHSEHKIIENDNEIFNASFLVNYFQKIKDIFIFGANNFVETVPNCSKGSWIVWERSSGDSMDRSLGSNFELCWSRERHKYDIARVPWKGVAGHNKKDDGGSKVHPSMKPVKLAEWFFERWGKNANLVIDLYLGSGSTLIACEKTKRRCFGMEIDPHYCDIILTRWAKYTGKDPVREDGKKWSEVKE